MVDLQRRWGQWRVYYLNDKGHTAYMPASWTDAVPTDPFVAQAQSRAIARVEDLLELTKMRKFFAGEVKSRVGQIGGDSPW